MSAVIRRGDGLMVRDVDGIEHPAIAASSVEGTHVDGRKVHDFPIVWVKLTRGGDRIPWPLEAVRSLPGTSEVTDGR